MPDRIESDRNISSGTGGLAVAFANDFNDTPSIYVTADSMATGDYFTIEFFDSGTTSVDRTFDWLARGFGKKP